MKDQITKEEKATKINPIEHRGEWLRLKVKESGLPINELGKSMGVHRLTIYRWFATPELSMAKIREACEIMGVDMYAYFPEAFSAKGLVDVLNENENKDVVTKYQRLLEKYTSLMEELLTVRSESEALKEKLKKMSAGTKTGQSATEKQQK